MTEKITYPQYAKSTDPEVIAAIVANEESERVAREQAFAFAKKHSDIEKPTVWSTGFDGFTLTGIESNEAPKSGRWRNGRRKTQWIPYRNNPLFAEFNAISVRRGKVPGVPGWIEGPMRNDFTHLTGPATLFILDGVAYSGCSETPTNNVPANIPWEEVKTSEFYKAMETYNERLAK